LEAATCNICTAVEDGGGEARVDGEGEKDREAREAREDEEDEGDEVDESSDAAVEEGEEPEEGDDTSFSCCCPLMDNRVLFNASMFLCRT